jgi:ABC-2 type transport system ATP-binding protein
MVLQLDNVTKIYRQGFWGRRVTAVRDLSIGIDENELVGFVGPNGAGKTTTIKMIMGLARPTAGTVKVNGLPSEDKRARRDVAFVAEQPYLYEHLTVRESLRFMGELRGLGGVGLGREVAAALERVGLADVGGRRVKQLSKGMQQRLNLGQALLGSPTVCIFDEPMSGMDPPGRSLFRRIFRELHEQGRTIFFSTHILDDVEALCSRVVVLSRGRVVRDCPLDALLSEGFEGTDLQVASLPDDLAAQVRALGCMIEGAGAGTSKVFVPAGKDPVAVEALLGRRDIFPRSIERRMKSLETLLYRDGGAS